MEILSLQTHLPIPLAQVLASVTCPRMAVVVVAAAEQTRHLPLHPPLHRLPPASPSAGLVT